ncbi:MAG: hypothetical protein FWD29_08190 [Micrococcales bacterium]|nr:hypothetical protein [Micrococcales bacterium]
MDILVRNVKPETKRALAEKASAQGRSLQAELLDVLEQAAAQPLAPPKRRNLRLAVGASMGESTWSRDEIYEAGR